MWLVSHLFRHEGRPVCPLQGHCSCTGKGKANWDKLLASMEGASVNWFPHWKEGRTRILSSCEGFPNVPMMGTRGCINYNLVLAVRQLGYPMRVAPSEESITPFIARGFSDPNTRVLQGVHKAWDAVRRKDKELRGSSNGIIDGYRKWLRVRIQGLDWLQKLRAVRDKEAEAPEENEEVRTLKVELEGARATKEKFKSMAIKVQREYDELRDVNMATTEALERETKRAGKEEHGQNKFQGTLWGSNSELKLRRDEKDQSRVEGMIMKDELKACLRLKRNLS